MFPDTSSEGLRDWLLQERRWWLRSPLLRDPRGSVDGVPLGEIVERLRFVYTEDAVEGMVRSGYGRMVLGLATGASALVSLQTMLAIGLDLCVAPETLDDKEIVNHLRLGKHIAGARLELGCWAGLRRHSYHPKRPKLVGKQPDLMVDCGAVTVAVECKFRSNGVQMFNLQRLYNLMEGYASLAAGRVIGDIVIAVSEEAVNLATEAPDSFERHLANAETLLKEVMATLSPDGAPRLVGRLGSVTMSPARDGFSSLRFDYEEPTSRRYDRVRNTFNDAASKFVHLDVDTYRVAVVTTENDYVDPVLLARVLKQDYMALPRTQHGFDAGVIIAYGRRLSDAEIVRASGTFRASRHEPLPTAHFFRALVDWRLLVPPPTS